MKLTPAKAPPKKPSAKAPAKSKWVFGFGNGKAEGRADMHNLLGGKGAGLAEMANLGLPVPPGFTITSTHYYENGNAYPKNLQEQVRAALAQVGRITGKSFGDGDNPLLVSVRSGARASMPGDPSLSLRNRLHSKCHRHSCRGHPWNPWLRFPKFG